MTNSLAIFQTIINNIFQNLIVESIIIVYLNNVLIFTSTLEEHYKTVCKVLEVLAKHKLFLFFKKYEFDKLYIEYLVLWQALDTQGLMISLTSKPQSRDIMWDIHKRTRQGASA